MAGCTGSAGVEIWQLVPRPNSDRKRPSEFVGKQLVTVFQRPSMTHERELVVGGCKNFNPAGILTEKKVFPVFQNDSHANT
jgi:hypothetical protein